MSIVVATPVIVVSILLTEAWWVQLVIVFILNVISGNSC